MDSVADRTIASWTDLSDALHDYRERGYLFRGQSDIKHRFLIPKVGRVDKAPGAARKYDYLFEDEERVFKDFKKAARPHLAHEPKS